MLSESYLYTQEMLEEALEHLTGRGMVVMQFGENDFAEPAEPRRPASPRPRATPTTLEASTPFDRPHRRGHVARPRATSSTASRRRSCKRTPFTTTSSTGSMLQVETIADDAGALPARIDDADGPRRSSPVQLMITTPADAVDGVLRRLSVRRQRDHRRPAVLLALHPVRRRHRRLQRRRRSVRRRDRRRRAGAARPPAASPCCSPRCSCSGRSCWCAASGRGCRTRRRRPRSSASSASAFIAFEITLIQKFSLFLGYPTYSLTVTLMSILLFTGIGAFISPRWHAHGRGCSPCSPVAIVALGLFYMLASAVDHRGAARLAAARQDGRRRRAVRAARRRASACSCRSRSRSCREATSTRPSPWPGAGRSTGSSP